MKAIFALCMFFLINSSCWAESRDFTTKSGLLLKGVQAKGGASPGWLVGGHFERFLSSSTWYFGAEAAYGKPTGKLEETLVIAAVNCGTEKVFNGFLLGSEIALGLASARRDGAVIGNLNIVYTEPQVYAGLVLGAGWRLAAHAGYMNVPSLWDYTGVTFGLRLDHKLRTTLTDVDD